MGIDENLGIAYAKSQMAANSPLPLSGTVFISVSDRDKPKVVEIAKQFVELGFKLVTTSGTATVLEKAGLKVQRLFKLDEGRPNALDLLKNREIQLVINTPSGSTPRSDEVKIRHDRRLYRHADHDDDQQRESRRARHRRPQETRLQRPGRSRSFTESAPDLPASQTKVAWRFGSATVHPWACKTLRARLSACPARIGASWPRFWLPCAIATRPAIAASWLGRLMTATLTTGLLWKNWTNGWARDELPAADRAGGG